MPVSPRLLAFVLTAGFAASAVANSTPVEIQVGTRLIRTDKTNRAGTPVVPMWKAPMPTSGRGAGFQILTEAQHAAVWQPPSREAGGYNHYAALAVHEGRFFAMWGNHPLGEDGPGQRILYAWSDQWGVWSPARELFAAPGPVKSRSESGIHLKADRWVTVDGTLYAVVYVHGAGIYPIARAVARDGSLDDAFLITGLPERGRLPSYMESEEVPPVAAKIRQWYHDNSHVSWWAWADGVMPRNAADGARLIEPFTYRARDGGYVAMLRYWGHSGNPVHNNRMYVSFSDDLENWSPAHPTDIPDSPSRAQALTLPNGTVLLIGNQIAPRFDTALYLDRDPMTIAISEDGLTFDRVYALRAGAPKGFSISGVGGRNPGFAYSSSLIHEGWLYTLYSVGKEDMAITRVRLSAMGLSDQAPAQPAAAAATTRPLFNGRNLDGWVIENNGQFSVRDGVIALDGGTGWLRSVDTFGDFVLDLEVRFLEEKANSGIYVRTAATSRDDASGYPDNGYQVQCMDTTEGQYALGFLIPFTEQAPVHASDRAALERAYRPTGEWQHIRITCRGDTLTADVNGVRVTTASGLQNLSGHVGIQGELGKLEFRRVDVSLLNAPAAQ